MLLHKPLLLAKKAFTAEGAESGMGPQCFISATLANSPSSASSAVEFLKLGLRLLYESLLLAKKAFTAEGAEDAESGVE